MREKIVEAISASTNLKTIVESFNKLCKELHEQDTDRIGYVAGIIFSEGPKHVERNIARLEEYTNMLRNTYQFPIFSSVDLFYANKFYDQIEDTKLPYDERRKAFIQFYRDILQNTYITDIFMTPRWEKSEGATDEHETAKKYNLTIHYLEDSLE
jgi:hypothetical protein